LENKLPQIIIASDHAGFVLKEKLKENFGASFSFIDLGPLNESPVDYPDSADALAQQMAKNPAALGVLVCGSGQGMVIRANRFLHLRAALCWSVESARLSREHNNANVLCLAGRLIDDETNFSIFQKFFSTPFAGGRHQNRVEKLARPTNI
jgi:ribose 5-phosphate isomerase B